MPSTALVGLLQGRVSSMPIFKEKDEKNLKKSSLFFYEYAIQQGWMTSKSLFKFLKKNAPFAAVKEIDPLLQTKMNPFFAELKACPAEEDGEVAKFFMADPYEKRILDQLQMTTSLKVVPVIVPYDVILDFVNLYFEQKSYYQKVSSTVNFFFNNRDESLDALTASVQKPKDPGEQLMDVFASEASQPLSQLSEAAEIETYHFFNLDQKDNFVEKVKYLEETLFFDDSTWGLAIFSEDDAWTSKDHLSSFSIAKLKQSELKKLYDQEKDPLFGLRIYFAQAKYFYLIPIGTNEDQEWTNPKEVPSSFLAIQSTIFFRHDHIKALLDQMLEAFLK